GPQRNGRAPEGKMDLIIMRGDKGFGFRLSGATHSAAEQTAQGQWVRNVDPDGQAARAGLQAGDRLLELNGVDVSFWSHRKVVDEIKRSGDVVAFRIARRLSPGPD
uniref:mbSHANK1 protein n=1 Tax=Monosiga brevicollis TaxID=81824 RepID=UPI0018A7E2E3|nr:Chain A, mbSHANK1 protein [Monosiga brevicollis]